MRYYLNRLQVLVNIQLRDYLSISSKSNNRLRKQTLHNTSDCKTTCASQSMEQENRADRILNLRELTRATLARQMLLERETLPAPAAIERLVGLHAQLGS